MIRSTLALITGFSLAALSSANKDFITLHTNGNAWIQEAIATLVLPDIPYPVTGDIALWSAIMMDDYNGDFLQGVTSSSPLYVYHLTTLNLPLGGADRLTHVHHIARHPTFPTFKATGAISHTLSEAPVQPSAKLSSPNQDLGSQLTVRLLM
jgi:hypothetical protein